MRDKVLFNINSTSVVLGKPPNLPKPKTYVHQIFAAARNEPPHIYANPRHYHRQIVDAVPIMKLSKHWKEDTPETYNKVFAADWSQTNFDEIINDKQQTNKLEKIYHTHNSAILDVFHYLQAKSKNYPFVDAKVV